MPSPPWGEGRGEGQATVQGVQPASVGGQGTLTLTQRDVNDNGRPDVAVIDCAFVTDHDRIIVLDQAGDMPFATDWEQATDFRDDIWLYDIGADDSVQLIVVYRLEEGVETAYLYDDQDGDGKVRYQQKGTRIVIQESPYWTARVRSGSSWFLPDGRLNLDVLMEIDGPVPFDRMPEPLRAGSPRPYTMPHDGNIDAEFEMVAGADGIAQYALKRWLPPPAEGMNGRRSIGPASAVFERLHLWGNEGRYPTQAHGNAFFPFLPARVPSDPDLRYFDLPPHLAIDWAQARVTGFGLAGYPIGHGWHFNSNQLLLKGELNRVDFESPHAYYDLAGEKDAYPELHIRLEIIDLPAKARAVAMYGVSYDWRMREAPDLTWDYKVDLGGIQQIDSAVHFRDFDLQMVPFEQLPWWVTQQNWAYGVLVAREGQGYESSEGIYEWYSLAGVVADTSAPADSPYGLVPGSSSGQRRYLAGLEVQSPARYYERIRAGFRGEYADLLENPVALYYSPVDHKLHLLGARQGVWNIDGRSEVRYANLDGDRYLDQWLYLEEGETRRQLNRAGGYLIYSGERRVVLKGADTPPAATEASFETLPPRDHEEWLALRQQLEADRHGFSPGDFAAMVAEFTGPEWRVEGAEMRDLRLDNGGFRFFLRLLPGFRASGANGPDLAGLSPGEYVVSYAGQFDVRPATRAHVELVPGTFRLSQPAPVALEPVQVEALLNNAGLEDLPNLWVQAYARQAGQPPIPIAETEVALLAGQPRPVSFAWTPGAGGEWQVSLVWGAGQEAMGSSTAGPTLTVDVRPSPRPTAGQVLRLSNVGSVAALASLLASVGLLAAASFVLALRGSVSRPDHQPGAGQLLVLFVYALAVSGYFVARYSARWAEADTSSFTSAIESMRQQASILPAGTAVYTHGFAYQAVSLALLSATGLPVQTLQAVLWPLLSGVGLVLTAFAFYTQLAAGRRITMPAAAAESSLRASGATEAISDSAEGDCHREYHREYSWRGSWRCFASLAMTVKRECNRRVTTPVAVPGALAGLLLLLQPDVLFVTLRGSHEKLVWPLMMVALTLLCLSLRRPGRSTVAYAGSFYLAVFALIATNVFFASTFLVAIIFSLGLGLLVSRLPGQGLRARASPVRLTGLRRLLYISLSCTILIFLSMFYIYPPSLSNLRTLRSAFDQLAVLLLGAGAVPGQPYDYISTAWTSPGVYLALTAFTWLLVVLSFVAWLWHGKQMLSERRALDLRQDLDWLLYAGFGLQVALSIVADFAGVLSENLQLRLFPAFTVLAVAMLARGAVHLASFSQQPSSARRRGSLPSGLFASAPAWMKRVALGLATLALAWFGIASVLKATNEPLISNKWTFYAPSEEYALRWVDGHLQSTTVWTGLDERLLTASGLKAPGQAEYQNRNDLYDLDPATRYVLFSERECLRATRLGMPMPSVLGWNRIYDDGDVRLYQQRPSTPYQK
jgi:hypothetical protein